MYSYCKVLPTEQRTCIKYLRELWQFLRINGESRNGWPKVVILLEICAFWHEKIAMTYPRSRMNRLNDMTVSRISVRLGWYMHIYIHKYVYIYVYIYMHTYICIHISWCTKCLVWAFTKEWMGVSIYMYHIEEVYIYLYIDRYIHTPIKTCMLRPSILYNPAALKISILL